MIGNQLSVALSPTRSSNSHVVLIARGGVLCFVVLNLVLLAGGLGKLVYLLYPAASLALGVLLYFADRQLFFTFCIWLWFVTPGVRRVVDFQTSFHEASLVVLAPLLASGVSVYSFMRKLPLLYTINYFPFLMIIVAMLYAFFVGVVNASPFSASYDLLLWIVPIAMGFSIATEWRQFPQYSNTIINAVLGASLFLGMYGLYQYFFLPGWDAQWMMNVVDANNSMGKPFPMELRLFGTLNSPVAYGVAMMAGLTLVVAFLSPMRVPMGVIIAAGLGLCLTRTAWLAFVVSVGYLVFRLSGTRRARLVALMVAGAALVVPVLTTGTIGERFMERLSTFEDVEGDKSYIARQNLYRTMVPVALTQVVGQGIGATGVASKLTSKERRVAFAMDSGLLLIPYVLGWPGALLTVAGLAALMLRTPGRMTPENEVVVHASTAICLAMMAMMLSYNSMYSFGGMVFWTFLGLRLSALTWGAHQRPG